MLAKVKRIINVGRFCDFNWSGGKFSQINIIFGNNGDGKSTLTAIFRSIDLNHPKYIRERKTFGSTAEQQVEMIFNEDGIDREVTYKSSVWTGVTQGFVIFDTHFVAQNIFDSEKIVDEHRSNLHRVVIGIDGKLHAEAIQKLSTLIRASSESLEYEHEYFKKEFSPSIDVETFLTLPPDPEVERKIFDLQNQRDFTALTGKPPLPSVSTKLPESLRENLTKDSASIHKRAKDVIEAHIKNQWLDKFHRKEFLAEGVDLIKNSGCPFCGQNLKPVTSLIDAYRSFFDEQYKYWEMSVRQSLNSFRGWNADSEIKILRLKIAEWEKYIPTECGIIIDWLDEYEEKLLKTKQVFDTECEKKSINLQYVVDLTSLNEISRLVSLLDTKIATLNTAIDRYKKNAETIDPKKLMTQLTFKKAVKARHEQKWIKFCKEYSTLKSQIDLMKADRDTKIKELRQYSSMIFISHQKKINEVLNKLGADFRVENLTEKTDRRKADPTYCGFDLMFFGKHRVMTEGQEEGGPNINNTLSQGDKSLLAFAFFIAMLWTDKELGKKIIVIDDPVSSFDRERKAATVDLLASICNSDGIYPDQLIILTHEIMFLSDIYGNWNLGKVLKTSYFNIFPKGTNSEGCKISDIKKFNPEESLLKTPEIKRYEKIAEWASSNGAIPDNAHSECRLLLEGIMKQKYWPLLREQANKGGGLSEFLKELRRLGIYSEETESDFRMKMPIIREPHHSSTEMRSDRSSGDILLTLQNTLDLAKKI